MRSLLKEARTARNISQEEAAKAVGISRSYYSLIEEGRRNPNYDTACKLAKLFKKSIKKLFPDAIFFYNRCYEGKQAASN